MFYERPDLTPPNEKQKRFTKCEHCEDGFTYELDSDNILQKEPCQEPNCDNGFIEIED